MPRLLAAEAAELLSDLLIRCWILHLLVFFRLVLVVLATWCILIVFTAAPPELATPLALVDATTPVEILRLDVVLGAILAHFLHVVDLALPRLQLFDSLLHLLALLNPSFLFLLKRKFRFNSFCHLVLLDL